jgi:hypothetical protein
MSAPGVLRTKKKRCVWCANEKARTSKTAWPIVDTTGVVIRWITLWACQPCLWVNMEKREWLTARELRIAERMRVPA